MERNYTLRCLHHWPTRVLCITLYVLQCASIDFYLIEHLGSSWTVIVIADCLVLVLFVMSFFVAANTFHREKDRLPNIRFSDSRHLPTTYVTWIVYAGVLDVKIGVIFNDFAEQLDETVSFFGPNTLKTSIALSGLIFLTFLAAEHDVRNGPRRVLIEKLTATVLFDVLDGVDSLDILFDKAARDAFPHGLSDAIIGIVCINFLLPTIPLFTLAFTRFGLKQLPEKLELLHKMSLAYLVNLPLFILRMISWHGLSQGVSIFVLKNVIVMGVTTFEVLEKSFTQTKEEEEKYEVETNTSRPSSIAFTSASSIHLRDNF